MSKSVRSLWGAAFAMAAFGLVSPAFAGSSLSVRMRPGEHWWGVCNSFGTNMPFTAETRDFKADLFAWNYGGQAASLLLSDQGRVVWCPDQTRVAIDGGVIAMESAGADVAVEQAGKNLREAYAYASARHFPPSGKMPDPMFFSAPQYNTWMELTYNQNERDVLAYAQSMLDHGLPPGVLMIDDTWQYSYGVWEFDPRKFRDPKGMCDKLHKMGFKVLLWIVPFVSLDSQPYRDLTNHGRSHTPGKEGFVVDAKTGEPAHVRWWNGHSALLDLTSPVGDRWLRAQLDRLRRDYGVDGFKLDGGHFQFYPAAGREVHMKGATGAQQVHAYSVYAEDYPTSEHRNVWGMAGRPVMVRLPDKGNRWSEVQRLVPDMLAAGLLGYPFICPDMIGGGSWVAYLPGSKTPYDKELFIRSAQVHALCPMMQFSVSPWRLMKDDPDGQRIICDLVALRQRFAPKFVELARRAGETGEPMMRSMEYAYPHMGYAEIRDQFMMGEDLLVAPVLEKGAKTRRVAIPPGRWRGDDGKTVEGPATIEVAAPLERLPHFVRESADCAQIFEADIRDGIIHGAAVVAGGLDGAAWSGSWGWADAAHTVPMTTRTVVDVASVTKAAAGVTAYLVAHARGLVDFDAPFTNYLPAYSAALPRPVTVRDLANHVSGFGEADGSPRVYFSDDAATMLRNVLSMAPAEPESGKVVYSCRNYILLGRAFEALTGRRLDEFCRSEIFVPAGMADTSLGAPLPTVGRHRLAQTMGTNGPGVISDFVARPLWAAGIGTFNAGMFSTAEDMARLMRVYLRGGICDDGTRLFGEAEMAQIEPSATNSVNGARSFGWVYAAPELPECLRGASLFHSGWSGQTVLFDLKRRCYAVVLTTRCGDYARAKRDRMQAIAALVRGQ